MGDAQVRRLEGLERKLELSCHDKRDHVEQRDSAVTKVSGMNIVLQLSFFLSFFWKVLTSLLLFDCFDRSSRRSSKSTIDKHFKLRKLRKKSLIDKPIVVQSVKLGGRNKGVKHRSSSTSSNSSKRNCSSYFLRPLSRRDYSLNQCTFTI